MGPANGDLSALPLRGPAQSTAKLHDGTLPALSVVNKIHQQPYDKHRVYNVELVGYDECFKNLGSKVNRETLWCDAFRVLIQALFLPFFTMFPPRMWLWLLNKCCDFDYKIRPRARPVDSMVPQFEDLEQTEQVPWDITALWRIQGGGTSKNSWPKDICVRLISALICSVVWWIVFYGPVMYVQQTKDKRYLQFFDCFGPLLAYGLGTLTIIVWCCHVRVLIGPKEHLLLYNKLVVHRPTRKYRLSGAKETDWAALTNLSRATFSLHIQPPVKVD